MKKLLLISIIALIGSDLFGQSNFSNVVTYTYKITTPINNDSKDSLKIENGNEFVIKIDTISMGDTIKLVSAKIIEKHSEQVITDWSKKFAFEEGESIKFEFEFKYTSPAKNKTLKCI